MLKTKEELQEQARLKNITWYPVRECTICGYQCGYHIDPMRAVQFYNSGCYCTGRNETDMRSWEDITDTYNMNQPEYNPGINQDFLDKLDKTWQFNSSHN